MMPMMNEEEDDMVADEAAAPDMSKLSSMLDAIQAQLDQMRQMIPATESDDSALDVQEDVVEGENEAGAEEEVAQAPGKDAAASGESDMARELLRRKMKAL